MTQGPNRSGFMPALAVVLCLTVMTMAPVPLPASPSGVFILPGGQTGNITDLAAAVQSKLGVANLPAMPLASSVFASSSMVGLMQPSLQNGHGKLQLHADHVMPDPLPGLYLLAGPWNGGSLALGGFDTLPFRVGLMELSVDRSWFVQGGFLMESAGTDRDIDTRLIPEAGLHQSTVQLSSEETVVYTWADTVLQYSAADSGAGHSGPGWGLWNLSLGGSTSSFALGLEAELAVQTGDLSAPSAWFESNRDEWKEVWTNTAPADAEPVLVLDHIELRERRAPGKAMGFSLFLPLVKGPHQVTAIFAGSMGDNSLSDVSSYYPAADTGLYAFETGATTVEDRNSAVAGALGYRGTLDTVAGALQLGLSGWAALEPGRDIIGLSIRQSWSNVGSTVYASFRQELEELTRYSDTLLWGAGASLRFDPSANRDDSGRFLALALAAEIQFRDESALVADPVTYLSRIERVDNNGDADFNDPSDTVMTHISSISTVEKGLRLAGAAMLSLPLVVRFPLAASRQRRISDARLEFLAGIEPRLGLEVIIQRQGSVDSVSTNTLRAGDEVEPDPLAVSVRLPTGHDGQDLGWSAGADWHFGLLLSLRGGASLQASMDGSGLEAPVSWSIRSLIPLR